jgi:hypothetical protein
MKKLIPFILLCAFLWVSKHTEKESKRAIFQDFINHHPYSEIHIPPEQLREMPKKDRPDLAWQQDFIMTMDPALGRPTPERLKAVYAQVKQNIKAKTSTPGSAQFPWVERGPDNVGGRTRTIMFDPNDATHKKVWAGGVTGGLWYNNDITDPNSQWVAQNDFWENLSITSMAYDPTNTNIFYVGTGEGWGSSVSGARGAGIWKSTDGGQSFSHLSASSNFYFVNDLVVRDENGTGVLYAGMRGVYYVSTTHGTSDEGLQRSLNGGTSFTQVLPNVSGQSFNYAVADIDIAADNRIWVGTINSGNSGSDRGGGRILYSDDGTSWTTAYTNSFGERVRLASAPSDSSYVYAIVEEFNEVGEIIRTTDHGATWNNLSEPDDDDPGISSTDFSRGQAWVHLALTVHPTNRDIVYAGSVDLFRTTDGGTNWDQLSHWYGGFGHPYVHADHHVVTFRPGSPSEAAFGNDGGVHYSSSLSANFPSFSDRNNGYNITQFYACAIHPNAGRNYFLAGSQDNGTHQFNSAGINSTIEVSGGDGAYCFIDQTDPTYQITSYVYNSYWLSNNGGASFPSPRIQTDFSTGRFINPTDYDDQQDALYSARNSTSINRIRNISSNPTVDDFFVSLGSTASNLKVSPHTTNSTTLFVGTGSGNLYKITNAEGNSPSSTSIGSNAFPNGYISGIDVGTSESELLVTFSNYGVNSVWYTDDGGSTWVNTEGNLPDMPVRWGLFNPLNTQEVILATEVGVWATSDITASTVSWSSSTSGLANVRVNMLQVRDSDYEVLAATYGRGLFTSDGFTSSFAPVSSFATNSNDFCAQDTLLLSDSSLYNPTSWNWTITPGTVSFLNGTSASSQNPVLVFNTSGNYQIILEAINANGMDSDTLNVTADILPKPTVSRTLDTLNCNENGYSYQWYNNGVAINGATNQNYIATANGDFSVAISSGGSCSSESDDYSFNSIGQNEISSAVGVNVFPNPASSVLNIRFDVLTAKTIKTTVYDLSGKIVQDRNHTSMQAKSELTLDVKDLPAGTFVLKVLLDETEVYSKPFIKS